MPTDLAWAFEIVMAPLVFALCLRHAHRALGAGRGALELLALGGFAFAVEYLALAVAASRTYASVWRAAPLGIPLAVPLVRASLVLSGLALAARAPLRTALGRAAAAALLGLCLDLVLEPVAAADGFWRFTPTGCYMGVPILGLLGRATVVGAYAWAAEAFSGRGALSRQFLARLLVALLALGALAGGGFFARDARIEERLPPAAGWAFWTAVLLSTLLLARHRRGSPLGTSVGSRMGAVPGHGPGLVFLVTATVFVTQAVLLGPPSLRAAALGPALVFVVVAGGDIHRAALVSWRQRMHGYLAGVESVVAVLMKRRNDQPWTRDERAFLQAELRAMARYLPALVLFLLPGSVVLLPVYAWLLDRRRGEREGEGARRIVAEPEAPAGGRAPSRRPPSRR